MEITDNEVLNLKVDANGENFSLGERQLMCMVRVLIVFNSLILKFCIN